MKHVDGFYQQQIRYYTKELVKCKVLVEHDTDMFELHQLFAPSKNPMSIPIETNQDGKQVIIIDLALFAINLCFNSFHFHLVRCNRVC